MTDDRKVIEKLADEYNLDEDKLRDALTVDTDALLAAIRAELTRSAAEDIVSSWKKRGGATWGRHPLVG